MTEHLEDIKGYYFLDPEDKMDLKPISTIDCEIVENIILILERMGSKTLLDILNRWKLDPDSEVLEALEFYLQSEQLDEEMKEKGGDFWGKLIESMKKAFVTIQDEEIVVDKIYSIKKDTVHDGRPWYTIILNRERDAPASYEWYIDKEFRWADQETRDLVVEELKKSMGKHTMCKFIN